MKKKTIFFSIWLISIFASIIWTHENPENIEFFKNYIKKNKNIQTEVIQSEEKKIIANSFLINLTKELSLSEKTAFLVHPNNSKFDPEKLVVYSQNGFVLKKLESTKINLPNTFTLQRNGGVKTVFFLDEILKSSIFLN